MKSIFAAKHKKYSSTQKFITQNNIIMKNSHFILQQSNDTHQDSSF